MFLEDLSSALKKRYIQKSSGWLLLEGFCDKRFFVANLEKLVAKIQEICFIRTSIELLLIKFCGWLQHIEIEAQ